MPHAVHAGPNVDSDRDFVFPCADGGAFQHVSAHLHKEAFNPFIELIENPGMTPVQTPGGPRFDNLSKLEKPFCAQASGAQTKFNRIRICLTA